MTHSPRPQVDALERARALMDRVLEPAEFLRRLAIPIGAREMDEARSLIRWFRRRYPTPAERLAYCRRAYRRWTQAARNPPSGGSPAPLPR